MTSDTRKKRQDQALAMFGEGTRGRILRGTAVMAARKGVRAVTVKDILECAGVSRRTFYKFFRGVEGALHALFEVSTKMLAGTMQMAVAAESDPVQRIMRALDSYLELQQVGGRLIMELQTEAIRADSKLAPQRVKLLDVLSGMIGAEASKFVGHPIDPLLIRGAILGVEGLVLDVQRTGAPFGDQHAERIRRVYLPLLLRTLGAPGAETTELPRPP